MKASSSPILAIWFRWEKQKRSSNNAQIIASNRIKDRFISRWFGAPIKLQYWAQLQSLQLFIINSTNEKEAKSEIVLLIPGISSTTSSFGSALVFSWFSVLYATLKLLVPFIVGPCVHMGAEKAVLLDFSWPLDLDRNWTLSGNIWFLG